MGFNSGFKGSKNKPYISKSLKTHHSKPSSRSVRSRAVFDEYQICILCTKYGSSRSLRKSR